MKTQKEDIESYHGMRHLVNEAVLLESFSVSAPPLTLTSRITTSSSCLPALTAHSSSCL